MLTLFDSPDCGEDSPPYDITEKHINKILADVELIKFIKNKIEITLWLGDDRYYYVIAQLLAYLYHKQLKVEGYSPRDILMLAKSSDFEELVREPYLPDDESKIDALMSELCELNILRKTKVNKYLFSKQSIYRYMGTAQEIEDELIKLMAEAENG